MYESTAKGRSRSAPTAAGRASKPKAPAKGGVRKAVAGALNTMGRNARATTSARENLPKVKAPSINIKNPIDFGVNKNKQAPGIYIGPKAKRP